MVAYSGFQSNAYQRNAYQIASSGVAPVKSVTGGTDNPYDPWNARLRAIQDHEENQRKLHANEQSLAEQHRLLELEEHKLAALRKVDIQESRAYLAATDAINKEILLIKQQNLMLQLLIEQFMREEEEIYVLMMCLT